MGFQSGLSGLNTASKNLDVIGNNVANASVVGFKGSQAQFADVFANSLSGGGASQIGIGAKVAAVAQLFTQGNISVTGNPLDVAINGKGFFRMDDGGAVTYSRNGQFRFDAQGYLVNSQGLNLTGYIADVNGNIVPSAPAPIQISFSDVPPRTTSEFRLGMNFDSRETQPTVGAFNPNNPESYNFSTSGNVYDSLGNPHVFSIYLVKTATAGEWQMYGSVDGTALTNANLGAGAGNPVTLNVSNTGAWTTTMPTNVSLTVGSGAVTPLQFEFDLTGSTQYGSAFGVNDLAQDGFASGRLAGFNVSSDGVIVGRYTNGQSRNLAQIVLADFRNPQGLNPIGDNQWEETSASGLPIVGVPGTGSVGVLQSSAVEDANIDLTSELVNMITAQRVYQANAQTIKTQDAILQTLVNLR
ncbi:MAG: flagellar hook protein FlgE [Burkholderiales bacterium]|nr:flagellar hook protein FlgE [Burkholderiales bacterium]MCW5621819.1 flagellar hook protein FlgE [Burkholderiales bacterium]